MKEAKLNQNFQDGVVTIDGEPIEYTTIGQGQDILFLHGISGNCHDWKEVMTNLRPGYRAWALTLPDYSTFRVAGYTRLVEAFALELGLKNPILVGISLGGIVSFCLYLENQALKPPKVILIATPLLVRPSKLTQGLAGLWRRWNNNNTQFRRLVLKSAKNVFGWNNTSPKNIQDLIRCFGEIVKLPLPKSGGKNPPPGKVYLVQGKYDIVLWLFRNWEELRKFSPSDRVVMDCGHFPLAHWEELTSIINKFLEEPC